MIWVGFGMQVAKTPSYRAMCRFPVSLQHVITIHQCYRQTDRCMDIVLIAEE